ncbi:helix-turn-helix transcriptional regulator [Zavarzinia aquatilis]|uniref:HTH luxR-type domain-containing protein n=1 Tax=Zavarzinia aquatilis TaxID=2211142 RepID=A0A317DUY8_9PROT|nr:helix-turn-helix transcriptional regulator [Zavarzinia aquatilis]PWR18204.1 hypothetical protein DKG74_19830 [Zavarzinia aquatilis]
MQNHDLLDLIYEAALDADVWSKILNRLSAEAGVIGATLFTVGGERTTALNTPGLDRSMEDFIVGGWDALNPLPDRIRAKGIPGFTTDRDVIQPHEFESNEFLRGFRRPWGLLGFAGMAMQDREGRALALSIETAESFSPEAAARLQLLVPHLKRSAGLSMRLQYTRLEQTIDVLDQIGCPAAAVSASGKCVAANTRFEGLPPGMVGNRFGQLVFADAATHRGFQEALAAIRGRRFADIRPIPCRGATMAPAIVYCMPLLGNARDLFVSAVALVIVRSGQVTRTVAAAVLASMFGLTAAEARIATIAATGATVEEIVARAGTSRETVRSQMKAIYAKTETAGRTELVLLLQRLHLGP